MYGDTVRWKTYYYWFLPARKNNIIILPYIVVGRNQCFGPYPDII